MMIMLVAKMAFDINITRDEILPDVWLLEPDVHYENRGAIWTSYDSRCYDQLPKAHFKHDKFSISKKNVLRGIHGDSKTWKLISCPFGDILSVIVDCREGSPTYLKHTKHRLNKDNNMQILIPPSFGNSFYVFSDEALYHYKLAYEGNYIDYKEQFTIAWNDPRLQIAWPTETPILSERDMR